MKYIKLKNLLREDWNDTDDLDSSQMLASQHIKQSLTPFVKAYVEAALFTSTDNLEDNGGQPLDKKYAIHDICPETLEKMARDCVDFIKKYEALYSDGGWSDEEAAHDFWLTRNGHGSGFWDKGYNDPEKEEIGKQLTKAAKSYGEFNLYLGGGEYDGLICGG